MKWTAGLRLMVLAAAAAVPSCLRASALPPRLLWSDRGANTIRVSQLDGSNARVLVGGLGEARGVDVDAAQAWMYWADNGENKIQRSRLDGSSIQDLVTTGLGFPAGVAVESISGKLYWADATNAKIQRSNLDGSQVEDFITGLGSPYFLALDAPRQQIYWTDYGARKIQRANFDGSNIQDLVSFPPNSLLRGIDLDLTRDKMYWTDRGTDLVQRANLDGTQVETLHKIPAAGVDAAPHGITVDAQSQHLYWVDNGTVKLQRSNLDGTDVLDLLTQDSGQLQRPWEIVFLRRIDEPKPGGCDLNGDLICDVSDIDQLTQAVRSGSQNPSHDLNGDRRINQEDRVVWVEELKRTYFGDANLDGEFNTADFVRVFQAGEYEDNVADNSGWSDGDWDGDGDFGTRDLVFVFQRGGFEAGSRPILLAVPEPASAASTSLAFGVAWLLSGRRRRSRHRG